MNLKFSNFIKYKKERFCKKDDYVKPKIRNF